MRTYKLPLYFSTRPGPAVEGMNNMSGMVFVYSLSITMGGLFNTATLLEDRYREDPNPPDLYVHYDIQFRGDNIYWTLFSDGTTRAWRSLFEALCNTAFYAHSSIVFMRH
jgi:hypothetical protein